jgi:transposase-like protein
MSTQAAVAGESVGAQGYRCETCRKTFRILTGG